jgi:multiple sugar transport system substrate-binding protein
MMYVNGEAYSLVDDGDVLMLYYRKDLFDDPAHQARYKAKTGNDLAPPATWDEFDAIATYFTEAMGPNLHGAAVQRNPSQLHYYFAEWFRNAGGKFFDADSMKATINSDVGVAVLSQMLAQQSFMPPGAAAWGPNEVMGEWLAGRLAMATWWPPLGRWSAGYGTSEEAMSFVPASQVVGKVGYAPMPGGAPELALGGAMALSPQSRNKEAAYLFMQWMNSPEISLQRVMLPISLRDPFRKSHFESAEYRALWPDAGAYLDAIAVGAKTGLIDLSIRNTFEYQDALIRGLQNALAGTDPKVVLDAVAAEWNEITERTGVDAQRAAYLDWASKPAAYPGD